MEVDYQEQLPHTMFEQRFISASLIRIVSVSSATICERIHTLSILLSAGGNTQTNTFLYDNYMQRYLSGRADLLP